MANKPSIVFLGAGPIATASLQTLYKEFDVEAVITKPRPPHHRGSFPLLELAEKLNLPLFLVENGQQLTELTKNHSFNSLLAVVVDFGILISKESINSFKLGIINSHFSLLPQWRGPDPIRAAILSGQPETGVSLMLIVPELDEGPLIAQTRYQLSKSITITELTDDLIKLSNQMLIKYLPLYARGSVTPYPQRGTPSYSKKLSKKDGIIDWRKPADVIEREIRAYLGWPGSRTQINHKDVIITAAHVANQQGQTGKVFISQQHELGVHCGKNSLIIDTLKPAGKKEMSGQDFIRGYLSDKKI